MVVSTVPASCPKCDGDIELPDDLSPVTCGKCGEVVDLGKIAEEQEEVAAVRAIQGEACATCGSTLSRENTHQGSCLSCKQMICKRCQDATGALHAGMCYVKYYQTH